MEKWGNEIFNTPALHDSNIPTMAARPIRTRARSRYAFALYEVLLGVAIFALGVISLGRAVENCLNASTINAEENVVRQILSENCFSLFGIVRDAIVLNFRGSGDSHG